MKYWSVVLVFSCNPNSWGQRQEDEEFKVILTFGLVCTRPISRKMEKGEGEEKRREKISREEE